MTSEIKCQCPDGYPKLTQQDYGSAANHLADHYGIPRPWFPKIAHTGQCPQTDQVPTDWLKEFVAAHETRS